MNSGINLLPEPTRTRTWKVRTMFGWLTAFLILNFWMYFDLSGIHEHASALNMRQHALMRDKDYFLHLSESVELKRKKSEVTARLAETYRSIQDNYPTLSLMVLLSKSIEELDGNLGLERIEITPSDDLNLSELRLNGISSDRLSVSHFRRRLQNSGYFSSVDIVDTQEVNRQKQDGFEFAIT